MNNRAISTPREDMLSIMNCHIRSLEDIRFKSLGISNIRISFSNLPYLYIAWRLLLSHVDLDQAFIRRIHNRGLSISELMSTLSSRGLCQAKKLPGVRLSRIWRTSDGTFAY